jgi:hypothetical protein
MSNLQQYTKVEVYLDGTLLSEEASVKVARKSGANNVFTVAKGFAGRSPGSPMLEISIESAVPAAGFEFNAGKAIKNQEVHELTLFAAGVTLTTKGFFDTDDLNHAVNSESKLSLSFVGEIADWV